MEEYEKAVSRVPKWKIQFVKDHLKYMIGKDDQAVARRMTTVGKGVPKKKKVLTKSQKKMDTRMKTKKGLKSQKTIL